MEFGLTIFKRRFEINLKALSLQPLSGTGGWWRFVREPYTGAWQRNEEVRLDTAMAYFAVFACHTLIMNDVGKCALRFVEEVEDDVWVKRDSPAFTPVLRKPNHYQTTQQFVETWISSKLSWGNAYTLRVEDNRQVTRQMYVLDPSRVKPLVATSGDIYYELQRDDLSGVNQARIDEDGLRKDAIVVPARFIMHDRMNALYHPLVGLSPLYAAGTTAMQGLSIQSNSSKFFSNGSNPGGILTAPGTITDETAARLKAYWDANYTGDNIGKVAVLGDGLKYEKMTVNPGDAQLLQTLEWTAKSICSPYHVTPYLIDIGEPPPYANIEPVIQKYFSQCLQTLFLSAENCLDEGLGLKEKINGKQYGVEFNISDLLWMDMAARNKGMSDGIASGGMAPNEARRLFHGLGPVAGGDTPYLQQQYYSLAALAERDREKPFAKPTLAFPTPRPAADDEDEQSDAVDEAASFRVHLRKSLRTRRKAA